MAYADQRMSSNRVTALIIVAVIHVAVGYMLISGLAYEGYKQVVKHITAVDVKDPDKKPPPPPPPPKNAPPPPIVAPPPQISIAVAPPPVQTVSVAPPAPVISVPTAAPPPPAPRFAPKGPVPRGNAGDWVTTDDYPSAADRERRQGVTGIRVTVNTSGRVDSCTVTSSSGSADLDTTACKVFSRRAKFSPATNGDGSPIESSYSTRIRWQLPSDDE